MGPSRAEVFLRYGDVWLSFTAEIGFRQGIDVNLRIHTGRYLADSAAKRLVGVGNVN